MHDQTALDLRFVLHLEHPDLGGHSCCVVLFVNALVDKHHGREERSAHVHEAPDEHDRSHRLMEQREVVLVVDKRQDGPDVQAEDYQAHNESEVFPSL